jgi:hypothetical protein
MNFIGFLSKLLGGMFRPLIWGHYRTQYLDQRKELVRWWGEWLGEKLKYYPN